MKFVLFYHSLVSDWNHGNAHFLRGVVAELLDRGYRVVVYEPEKGWSRAQLRRSHGDAPIAEFECRFPHLRSRLYDPATLDLEQALDGADAVLVHEWNEPDLIARIGRHAPRGCRLLFHDTHHRSATAPREMAGFDLSRYDGVLAFGEAVRRRYLEHGWSARAWTWHEAADTRVFHPLHGVLPSPQPLSRKRERGLRSDAVQSPSPASGRGVGVRAASAAKAGDLVWIGNWGDGERSRELAGFLLDPVRRLGLSARIHGVRYPHSARVRLAKAGIDYRGWLPNWRVPETFARFRVTVHVPRRPYVRALPGVPTIRVFEALACGIPLVCAPWPDEEGLFSPGRDYLVAKDGAEMQRHLREVLRDRDFAEELAAHGLRTVRARHTCAHRVDQLLAILAELGASTSRSSRSLSHA